MSAESLTRNGRAAPAPLPATAPPPVDELARPTTSSVTGRAGTSSASAT